MNTARLNSHDTHSDSVVITDILLRTLLIICTPNRRCGVTSLRQQNYLNYPTFINYFRHVAMLQKFAGPLVGAAVRLNMRNMPKSASVS